MLMSDVDVLEIKQRSILEFLFKYYDLNMVTSDYQVPVFYIHGEDDWQTPYSLAHTYFINSRRNETILLHTKCWTCDDA